MEWIVSPNRKGKINEELADALRADNVVLDKMEPRFIYFYELRAP